MLTLTGKTKSAFLFFFASHIPATICIDMQALFPGFYPKVLQDLLHWYTESFNDHLMRAPHDTWFRAIVAGEVLFQLPFFFVAVKVLLNSERYSGKGWFRSMCMVYGTHTSTTLIPIMACHAANGTATIVEKVMVISIYLPYLIFPLWLACIAFLSDDVFGRNVKQHQQ